MTVKTIYVKTTGSCNLNCGHCFTSGRNGDATRFDPIATAQWIKELRTTFAPGTHTHLELHGGEPFLVPLELLETFAGQFTGEVDLSMGAQSNLTFTIKDQMVNFIRTELNSYIGTSWDPWIRWEHEKQYQLWRSNLDLLNASGIQVGLLVSMCKNLIDQKPEWFLEQMEALPVTQVSLERLTLSGNATRDPSIFPDNEDQDNWYLELLKLYQTGQYRVKIKTLDILIDKIKYHVVKTDTNCRNCEQNLVTINSNGTLGGCPNVASTHRHAHIRDSVETFLKSPDRIEEIVKELDFSDVCVRCDVFDLCGGDCHRLAWQGYRCAGLKNTLRYLSGRSKPHDPNLIIKV